MSLAPLALPEPPTPADAWAELAAGNERFATNRPHYPNHHSLRRTRLADGQKPFATIFGCSDSRVPPELLFDRGLGDLFVVRTAGHVVDPAPLGSLEYGVHHLSTPLLAVVGHESCGAVGAALACAGGADLPGGHVNAVVERITPSVQSAKESGGSTCAEIVAEHVRVTMRDLVKDSSVIAHAVDAGRLAIVGLAYDLAAGRISLLDSIGVVDEPARVA